MSKAFCPRAVLALTLLFVSGSVLPAQFVQPPKEEEWARAMIEKEKLSINFKSVGKGQDVYVKIKVTNVYQEEMQITGLTTSCGCISWDEASAVGPTGAAALPAPIVVPSGESRSITLRLDTVRHGVGEQKNKRGFITFFEPANGQYGIATVVAEAYIRSDVVVNPGSVNFGSIAPETPAEQRLTLNYAGRNDWRIISAKCGSPYLTAEAVEKGRGNGLVNYDVIVKLKENAPIGVLRDQLVLVTDDQNNPQMPIQVEARIEPDIIVTDVDFGSVTAGKPKAKQVLVRYTKVPVKPFKIEKCERTKTDTTFRVTKSDETKPLHTLTLTFTPPNEPGKFEEEFFLTISGRKDPITFKAKGRIIETTTAPGAGS